MPSGVYLTFFGSFVFGTPGSLVGRTPERHRRTSQERQLDAGRPRLSFSDIREAHRVMEAGEAGGKIVVVLD